MGPAVLKAAQEARERVLNIAAAEMETSVQDLEMVNGEVRVKGVPGKVKTLRDIYRLSASFGAKYEPVLGKGESAITQRSPGTGVHIARVRVDPETFRVEPLRYVVVQDVGRAINPATVEEQIHGGGAQGVGWAVYEEIVHDESGTPITASFMDYTVPKARQMPELEAVLVEVPSPIGPYGAKPVGEPPVIPGGAVIANAVAAAVGARVTELPLTPERVSRAITNLIDNARKWSPPDGHVEVVLRDGTLTVRGHGPGFNERAYGFRSFSDLLLDAQKRGLVKLEADEKSGGKSHLLPTGSNSSGTENTRIWFPSPVATSTSLCGGSRTIPSWLARGPNGAGMRQSGRGFSAVSFRLQA